MAYTIWSKPYHSSTWVFCGLQLDSEKLAEQTFTMYRLAPGETIQLRDPDGIVMDERRDNSRPHPSPVCSALPKQFGQYRRCESRSISP